MNKEIFKDIKGYEGIYEISNFGRVKSLSRLIVKTKGSYVSKEKIIKGSLDFYGYRCVTLHKDNSQSRFKIHQLVMVNFLGHNPDGFNGLIVDHIDGNRDNNNLNNLQLITQRENASRNKRGSSIYTGVNWHKQKRRWQSRIYINGKRKHLGMFKCELAAAHAYQKALKELT